MHAVEVVRACSHCVWPKRTLFFTWMRFGHVLKYFASTWKTASVRFRFSARAAWTYETITFSQPWLSGAFQWALFSYWAVDVDELTLQKAINQLLCAFEKKIAHFWTGVWPRLRLRESSPPVRDPRLSAFELAFTWKWDPVLESAQQRSWKRSVLSGSALLRVTMATEQPTLWPESQASWLIARDVNASRNFDDFHGAISCRITYCQQFILV